MLEMKINEIWREAEQEDHEVRHQTSWQDLPVEILQGSH